MDFNPFKHRISELNSINAEKGTILISEPFMKDPYFKRSVVLLCERNEDGTVGFILNQPLNINLSDVISDDLGFNSPLFLGGPVEPQNLFFIHTCESLSGSISISDDLYWSGDFEMLKLFLSNGTLSIHEVKFFLGYSGWDADQLKGEIASESWLISKMRNKDILAENTETLWREALEKMGKEQALLATFPEDPSLN